MKTNISPVAPKALKLAQVDVEKLYATYRLSKPINPKKAIQAKFRRCQTVAGRSSCSPIIVWSRFLRKKVWLTQNDKPMAQYSTLGFHLMKVALWNHTVAPPSTTTSTKVIHNIMSIFWRRASK